MSSPDPSRSRRRLPGTSRAARTRLLVPLLLFPALLAGCGGAFPTPGGMLVDAGSRSVHTGGQLRLSALDPTTGDPLPVTWRITSSNNAPALGPGTIAPDGTYTPPGSLSRDLVTITIAAIPQSAGAPISTQLSVTAGFVQPLQPENATLAAGASIEVRAQLAEVNAGSVSWELQGQAEKLQSQAEASPAALGTLSAQHCQRGPQQFTTCTVTYTAPPAGVSPGTLVSLAATPRGNYRPAVVAQARLMLGTGITSNPALHQAAQLGAALLGGSGGNDNDFDTYQDAAGTRYVADCCGGTLGALVSDQAGTTYILSNNHVLAESDQAQPGDVIEQPGLIDDGCLPLTNPAAQLQPLGTLRYAVPLASGHGNVDAALALATPGAVDSHGSIFELGAELGAAVNAEALSRLRSGDATLQDAPPTAGPGEPLDAALLNNLSVVKSGRTTGLTCSTIDALDLSVRVDYYKDCAETLPDTTKLFTGQIGIGGDAFADSGDSGALVLDASNARAIGLLYATATTGTSSPGSTGASTGLTLANPIGDVLNELGAQAGSRLSLVGTAEPHPVACLNYDPPASLPRPPLSTLAPDERARTTAALNAALDGAVTPPAAGLLATSSVTSLDDPSQGAITLARTSPSTPVPATLAGVRTVPVPTEAPGVAPDTLAPPIPAHTGLHLTPAALAAARATTARLAPRLMQLPAIFGVGVAQSLDSPDEPALLVLLDSDAPRLETARLLQSVAREEARQAPGGAADPDEAPALRLPAVLGGLRVRYLAMHRFRVTQSKYIPRGTPSGCALRSIPAAR
ncbi:MAG TPA: hypothetical protein VGD62_10635 [Acidobacteriaceae bacterium]